MSRVVICALFAWLTAIAACDDSPPPAPVPLAGICHIPRKTFDLGDVAMSPTGISTSFTIQNKGDGPLAIKEIVLSCSCMEVEQIADAIPPGGELSVPVRLRADVPGEGSATLDVSPDHGRVRMGRSR